LGPPGIIEFRLEAALMAGVAWGWAEKSAWWLPPSKGEKAEKRPQKAVSFVQKLSSRSILTVVTRDKPNKMCELDKSESELFENCRVRYKSEVAVA